MEFYKFGKPDGRFIGSRGEYDVYSRSISPRNESVEFSAKGWKKVPGEFSFFYGPATGGLIESVAVELVTPGELIRNARVFPDFKKRMIKIRGLTVSDAILQIERINGFHSASHSIAFISAVEDALGIKADEEVSRARIFMIELERIRSNLEVLKRMCEPAGFGVPVNQIGYLREEVSRIISSAAGHRYFFGANQINKALVDFREINDKIPIVRDQFERIFNALQESKIFLNRLQNNGIARNIEMTGPAARASGISADARMDSKTLDYSRIGYDPVVRNEGDSFGRFMVRGEEIIRSSKLLETLEAPNPQGEKYSESSGTGEGAARVESPQGDLFYYVKLKDGAIEDVWFVSPSQLNIRAFEHSMNGNIFTDFHFNWESFGIWISEMGVEIL